MDITWTPVITVAGAFATAITGQFLANKYERRRENDRYNKDCLQKLYSPLVLKIEKYLNAEKEMADIVAHQVLEIKYCENVNYLKLNLVNNPNSLFKEIKSYIRENLVYAHPDLIMLYEKGKDYGDYKYGEEKPNFRNLALTIFHRVELCSAILSDYLSINKQLNSLSKTVKEQLEGPSFFTQVLLILFNLQLFELPVKHAFGAKELIQNCILQNPTFYTKAETLRKEFDEHYLSLLSYKGSEINNLKDSAYEFILDLFEDMELYEPQIAELLRNELRLHRNRREKLMEEKLKKMRALQQSSTM